MFGWIDRFVRDEQGQDLVEYAFLIVFIAFVAVIGANQVGVELREFYNRIATTLSGISPPPPAGP